MAVIKLKEDYAVTQLREAVRDSLMYHGEECVLLTMYHVNADENVQPRCADCYNSSYKQSRKSKCPTCYGTTFQGGVKLACRAWALFSDNIVDETYAKHGVWSTDRREIQTEGLPLLLEHDYAIRVRRWSLDHRVEEIEGIYGINQVTQPGLRTGARFGQNVMDIAGQRASLSFLQEESPIYLYKPVGQKFDRIDGRPR